MNEEICVWCGHRVDIGSDRFINRVPMDETMTPEERIESGWEFPEGCYCCYKCENEQEEENPHYRCLNCNEIGFFEEILEHYGVCPYCGSANVELMCLPNDEEIIKDWMSKC